MRITVNGRFLSQSLTGVQRYAREITARQPDFVRIVAPSSGARGARGHLWEQSVLPVRCGRDLLWSPSTSGPLAMPRQVVTIHDCASLDCSVGFSARFVAWYSWLIPRLARRVRRIITVSEFSRGRIVDRCGVPESKVVVIYPGVGSLFQPASPEAVAETRQRLRLPQRYVLCVGSLENRKNLRRLVEAWRLVEPAHPDVSLVLVGGVGHVFRDAGLHDLPKSVVLAGYVDDECLPAVYGGAELFVYPSLYEGFGSPVVEAMACGVPVLTSNITSLPEVAGQAAAFVDPYSRESIADGITTLLNRSPAARRAAPQRAGSGSHV